MTLPRELSIQSDILIQNPPAEITARRGEKITFDESGIQFKGDSYEIEVEIDLVKLKQTQVGFRLRVGGGEATRIFYDTIDRKICIDRSQSGQVNFHSAFSGRFRELLELKDDILKLRIFVDRCSIEVFAQDGELYGAMLVFPGEDSQNIEFFGAGAHIKAGAIYPYEAERAVATTGWAGEDAIIRSNGSLQH